MKEDNSIRSRKKQNIWAERRKELANQIKQKIKRAKIEKISKILSEFRKEYIEEASKFVNDPEQSWKSSKGKILEDIIYTYIEEEIINLGLGIVKGRELEREVKDKELSAVKRNLLVDFGEFGMHLPDADLVVYSPENFKVLFIISSKATLRERIAQTGYWKLKLSQNHFTKHIKVFFITPDEDQDLKRKSPAKKGRAISEVDTDGTYVITEEEIEESNKVKKIDKFISDIKRIFKDDIEKIQKQK